MINFLRNLFSNHSQFFSYSEQEQYVLSQQAKKEKILSYNGALF